jgi:RHS repeat-associated protein
MYALPIPLPASDMEPRARGCNKYITGTSTNTTYLYNALGQRVKKSGSGITTTHYLYDEAGHLLGEYNGSGSLIQETLWLGDIPVATLRPKSGGGVDLFYVHTDHLNTPRKVTRPSDNAIRWRWDPDPFGTGAPNQNPQGLGTFVYHLRLPGQYFDTETALHYNYFRNYDPQIGRYLESDPIGLHGGINTFGYANQNPLTFVDPDGRNPGAAARGGWALGRAASIALNRVLIGVTGTTLGGLIYEMCNEDSEEARCMKVYKDCANGCADIYSDNPDKLPGTGPDLASRVRRCISECVKAAGCSPFTGS